MFGTAVRDGLQSLQNVSSDDILAALGLQKQRTLTDAVVPSLALFAAGALVGAAAAVLLTPKTGPMLRRELTEGAKDLSQKLGSSATNVVQDFVGSNRSNHSANAT